MIAWMPSRGSTCRPNLRLFPHLLPEGEDGGDGEAEVHDAEGKAHDCEAEDEPAHQVDDGDLPPAEEDPDEVHDDGYTAGFAGAVHQFGAEGPEGVGSQLEQLQAEGDADDGDAHQQAHDVVDDGYQDAAQDEPEEVADGVHLTIR